jgi:radical SAM-linked protein
MKYFNPVDFFGPLLSGIDKPARYLGGECGSIRKKDAAFRMMLCFPDMYEIGMSNNAMRILYAAINDLEGIACERVFTPASDFEVLLRSKKTLLYGLESGTQVTDSDILGFTVGYELAATNILSVLDLSGIPLHSADRCDSHPIVIAGGPAMTNPAPYTAIFDAVWIGEAEDAFFTLLKELAKMKQSGADRKTRLDRMASEPAIWIPGKKTSRHVFPDFSTREYGHRFPTPVVKPVQDHGVVEIMRGCPNGCRFCHAGYFYRPQRLRRPDIIHTEVETQVRIAGHRAITLSSLSSGDYPGIFSLLKQLNERWGPEGISFQLPSLKIESFPLELLEQLSGTRKGGLTFAIETPLDQWQMVLNKQVSMDKIRAIFEEAGKSGYRLAKFYFMIGLPVSAEKVSEEQAIIDFLKEMASLTPMKLNVTLASFVPKPHTPFQWCAQIEPDIAIQKIYAIKDAFRNNPKVKITYHAPFLSWLEGMIARGDERVGDILIEAYHQGARFDAWDDKFRKDIWQSLVEKYDTIIRPLLDSRQVSEVLPWDDISIGVTRKYFEKEYYRSQKPILTSACIENCTAPCGACNDSMHITDRTGIEGESRNQVPITDSNVVHMDSRNIKSIDYDEADDTLPDCTMKPDEARIRFLFNYSKTGAAAYYAHHGVWEMLATAITRTGFSMIYSEGFNPAPRLEISEPLPLGFSSNDEYGTMIVTRFPDDTSSISRAMNTYLPEGIRIQFVSRIPGFVGVKFPSLSSVHWGSSYCIDVPGIDFDSSMIMSKMQELIASTAELSSASLSLDEQINSILVLLPFTGKRELGLSSLFETATGIAIRNSTVQVKRLSQFARGTDGNPIPYKDFYGISTDI